MLNLCSFDICYPLRLEKYIIPAGCGDLGKTVCLPASNAAAIRRAQEQGCTVYVAPENLPGVLPALAQPVKPLRFHCVETDNYGGDYPDESWVARGLSTLARAETVAAALNKHHYQDGNGSRYVIVVPDGYRLKPGFEP